MQVRNDGAAREKVDPVKEGLPVLVTKPSIDTAIRTGSHRRYVQQSTIRAAVYN